MGTAIWSFCGQAGFCAFFSLNVTGFVFSMKHLLGLVWTGIPTRGLIRIGFQRPGGSQGLEGCPSG